MKYIHLNLIWALALLAPLYSNGQDSYPIFPDLNNQEALDSVVTHFKPTNILSYSQARDYLYGTVYNVNDTVECVYSGHKLHLPLGVDPSTYLFKEGSNDGINCEHTFPRSKGASEENGNAYSDMHHLFPTRSQVNSGRENFPFAEIPDEESTHWYFQDEVRSFTPLNDIDSYSERVNGWFEPREIHKGNAARATFYFYTMYKEEADEADVDFFDIQKETLCKWNLQDPVDQAELRRTNLIAEKQDDLGNPFVIDNSLVERCYCAEYVTTTNDVFDITLKESINIYPNPVSNQDYITIESTADQNLNIVFYNRLGVNISNTSYRLTRGENRISLSRMDAGVHFFNVFDLESGKIVKTGKVIIMN